MKNQQIKENDINLENINIQENENIEEIQVPVIKYVEISLNF